MEIPIPTIPSDVQGFCAALEELNHSPAGQCPETRRTLLELVAGMIRGMVLTEWYVQRIKSATVTDNAKGVACLEIEFEKPTPRFECQWTIL